MTRSSGRLKLIAPASFLQSRPRPPEYPWLKRGAGWPPVLATGNNLVYIDITVANFEVESTSGF